MTELTTPKILRVDLSNGVIGSGNPLLKISTGFIRGGRRWQAISF